MSNYGALFTGVSGEKAQGTLSVISDIENVNLTTWTHGSTVSSIAINWGTGQPFGAANINVADQGAALPYPLNMKSANCLANIVMAQRACEANMKVLSSADRLLNDLKEILK